MDAQVPPTVSSHVAARAPLRRKRAAGFCWGLVVGAVWGALLLLLYFTLADPACFGAPNATAACPTTASSIPLRRPPAAALSSGGASAAAGLASVSRYGNHSGDGDQFSP
jgi:hypothetical protein